MAKEIKRRILIVRKRKLLLILTTVLGLMVSQFYLLLKPSKYTCDIIVEENQESKKLLSTDYFWNSGLIEIIKARSAALADAYKIGTEQILSDIRKKSVVKPARNGAVLNLSDTSSKNLTETAAIIEDSLKDFITAESQKPLIAEKEFLNAEIEKIKTQIEVHQLEKVELNISLKDVKTEDSILKDLAEAKSELNRDSRIYTDRHPKIINNKKRVELLEKELTDSEDKRKPVRELNAKIEDLTAGMAKLKGRITEIENMVIDASKLPAVSVSLPKRVHYQNEFVVSAAGILLGLLAGVLLIFISEHLDVSMDSVKEIETYLGLKVVGLIPHIERRTKKLKLLPPMFAIRKVDRLGVMRSRLLFNHPKDSLFMESYINMAGRYFLKQLYMQTNTFLFSSSEFNEGKSITCCNVALACAYLDKKTLLVEADLERPSINRVFDITRNPGLTDCVIGNTPWRGIVKNVSDYTNSKVYGEKLSGFPGIKNLDLITFGQILRDNKTLFGNPKLPIIMNEMKSVYDVVIFDCSPILKTDDVLSLAKHISGVFLVYQLGRINRGNLRKARLVLEKNQIACTGVLVNDIPVNDYYRILKNSYGG